MVRLQERGEGVEGKCVIAKHIAGITFGGERYYYNKPYQKNV